MLFVLLNPKYSLLLRSNSLPLLPMQILSVAETFLDEMLEADRLAKAGADLTLNRPPADPMPMSGRACVLRAICEMAKVKK